MKLEQFYNTAQRTIYARIIAMNVHNEILDTIEGIVNAGSINIDGASSIHRSCQLTLVSTSQDINDYLWSLNTRFKLEIGISTLEHPEIRWTKQGVYIITAFNASVGTNNRTVNISGKDKMCLLNGEVSGTLNSQVDFGNFEEVDAFGNVTIHPYPILDIIREAVHQYGGEPFYNIIINDLDQKGLELLEYRYDKPMYLIRENDSSSYEYTQVTFDGTIAIQYLQNDESIESTLGELPKYDDLSILGDENSLNGTTFTFINGSLDTEYVAARLDYGETAGYRETPLIYTGELIGNVGETVDSILTKIKTMLGEYEYFYDLDGRFVFQKTRTYNYTKELPQPNRQALAEATQVMYTFDNLSQFTAINVTPNINNIKNDFTIRGKKSNGNTQNGTAILFRYAIDKKPYSYTSIAVSEKELETYNKENNMFTVGQDSTLYLLEELINSSYYNPSSKELVIYKPEDWNYTINNSDLNIETNDSALEYIEPLLTIDLENIDVIVSCTDWREIIYQMAKDHQKYGHLYNFTQKIIEANKNSNLYPSGHTGYEQYYIDLLGFWRDLYNPDLVYKPIIAPSTHDTVYEKRIRYNQIEADKLDEYKMAHEAIYIQVIAEPQDNIDRQYEKILKQNIIDSGDYYIRQEYYIPAIEQNKTTLYALSQDYYPAGHQHAYWARQVFESPHELNFWFDFLDNEGELDQYAVFRIGHRPKIEANDKVKSIYYQEIPRLIFYQDTPPSNQTGYALIHFGKQHTDMFRISTQGKSAYETVNELLYTYTQTAETLSITSVPVYELDVNSRIKIIDIEHGVNGEYIVSKLTVPLTYNGTMNITATKATPRIL